MVPITILLFVCIAVPLVLAWQIFGLEAVSWFSWVRTVAEKLVFIMLVLLAGRWDIAGMWTPVALAALFFVVVLISWRRNLCRNWREDGQQKTQREKLFNAIPLVLYLLLFGYVAAGTLPHGSRHDLGFPLRGGIFVVAQGGSNVVLNHHATHPAQRYAVDITAINRYGFRASGLLPADLNRFVVFGTDVVSPCDGEVIKAIDGLPDLIPPTSDSKNPAGNSIIIICNNTEIELAHLSKGSVAVAASESVTKGQHLARVGNSGNTTEPHLHIHAVNSKTRRGVPLSFANHSPVRNQLFVR